MTQAVVNKATNPVTMAGMGAAGAVEVGMVGDAAKVADVGRGSQAHNRYISGVAETQATLGHMTFTENQAVYRIRFKATVGAGTPTVGDVVRVVFDAAPVDDITNDTQAWNWLQTATTSATVDVEYFEFVYIPSASLVDAEAGWSRWYEFTAPLRRCDFHYPNGTATTKELAITAEVG